MNIAFLTSEYVTEKDFDGGLSNYLYRVCHALNSRGHHIEIFTLSEKDEDFYHDGLLIHRVANKAPYLEFMNKISRYKLKRTLRFLALSYCINKKLRLRQLEQVFDIVQAASCFACGLFSTFDGHIPIVTRVSSYEPLFREFYRKPLTFDQKMCEWLELLTMRRSRAVYAPSRFLSNVIHNKSEIKTDIIRSPFYLENESLDESTYYNRLIGKKYFLFFGAIGYLKGCEIIAECLPLVLNKFPEMYFVFAGKNLDGPNGLTMIDYIILKAGDVANRILYIGALFRHQLYPIIKNAHAIVLPSLVDNFPNAMVEAMALGKIVIGTQGTSFEELIENHVSGILIEPNNVNSLKDAMEKIWIMDIDERMTIGNNARKKTEELSPSKICDQLEMYFQSIISNNLK